MMTDLAKSIWPLSMGLRWIAPLGFCVTIALHSIHSEPLSLQQAISEAKKNGASAKLMEAGQSKLSARKSEVWAEALPKVAVYANAGRGNSPQDGSAFSGLFGAPDPNAPPMPDVFSVTQTRYSYGVEVKQPIFSFGRTTKALHTANLVIEAQSADDQRGKHQIGMEVTEAYYACLISRANVNTLEDSRKRYQETLDFLDRNFSMGSGAKSQNLLAKAALRKLEPEILKAKSNAELAQFNLNRLLGRPLESPLEIDSVSAWNSLPTTPIASQDEAASVAIEKRQDLKSLELNKKVLVGTAEYMTMLYRPSIEASGKLGILAYKTDQLTDFDNNKEWQIGIGMYWPLFDGFGLRSKARQFRSDARSLEIQQVQARQGIEMEARSAYVNRVASDSSLAAMQETVDALREAYSLMKSDFNSGKGVLMDLLGTEDRLREAELGLLAAEVEQVKTAAHLRVVLGYPVTDEETAK